MSTTIITGHLNRLVEQLGDLRVRLKQAARLEVAQAVGDALADTAKMLIRGAIHVPREMHEDGPWDDPWHDPFAERPSWTDDRMNETDSSEPTDRALPARSALLAGFAVARWSMMRTGQPTVAIGLASLTAIVILIAGDRIAPLLDVCAATHELLDFPERRP